MALGGKQHILACIIEWVNIISVLFTWCGLKHVVWGIWNKTLKLKKKTVAYKKRKRKHWCVITAGVHFGGVTSYLCVYYVCVSDRIVVSSHWSHSGIFHSGGVRAGKCSPLLDHGGQLWSPLSNISQRSMSPHVHVTCTDPQPIHAPASRVIHWSGKRSRQQAVSQSHFLHSQDDCGVDDGWVWA